MNTLHDLGVLFRRYGVPARHLIHVGAHEGQEVPIYRSIGFDRITLVEPVPELADRLRQRFPDTDVVQKACGSVRTTLNFYVYSPSNLSSLVRPVPPNKLERVEEVEVEPLDDLCRSLPSLPNVAVVDAQGLELDVLRSADFDYLDMVVVETCTRGHFAAGPDDVHDYMTYQGFMRTHSFDRRYDDIARWAYGSGFKSRPDDLVSDVVYIKEDFHL